MMIRKISLMCALSLAVFAYSTADANAATYSIEFKLYTTATYRAVQFDVDYAGAPGEITGEGPAADCTANSGLNALTAFYNVSPDLSASFIHSTGMSFAAVLMTCDFESTGTAPVAGDFSITIVDWESATTSTTPFVRVSNVTLQ